MLCDQCQVLDSDEHGVVVYKLKYLLSLYSLVHFVALNRGNSLAMDNDRQLTCHEQCRQLDQQPVQDLLAVDEDVMGSCCRSLILC